MKRRNSENKLRKFSIKSMTCFTNGKENYCKKNNISLLVLNKENYNEEFILNWIKNLMEVSHNGN